MATKAKLRIRFNTNALVIPALPSPDLLTLLAVVTDVLVVQVEGLLQNEFTLLIDELNDNRLERVLDIENDGLVPDGSRTDAKIRLSIRVMLPYLNLVLTVFQVLCINDVYFELGVASDAHLGHELALALHGLLQLELDFFLLAVVVCDIAHNLFFTLL